MFKPVYKIFARWEQKSGKNNNTHLRKMVLASLGQLVIQKNCGESTIRIMYISPLLPPPLPAEIS